MRRCPLVIYKERNHKCLSHRKTLPYGNGADGTGDPNPAGLLCAGRQWELYRYAARHRKRVCGLRSNFAGRPNLPHRAGDSGRYLYVYRAYRRAGGGADGDPHMGQSVGSFHWEWVCPWSGAAGTHRSGRADNLIKLKNPPFKKTADFFCLPPGSPAGAVDKPHFAGYNVAANGICGVSFSHASGLPENKKIAVWQTVRDHPVYKQN